MYGIYIEAKEAD